MNGPFPQLTDAELQKRRAEIQRSLNRINTAAGVIVVIVIGLAITAIFAAYRAGKSAREARAATTRAEEQLWRSYLAQAQAGRLSGVPGSRQAGLDALKAAARIRRDPVLRNEYVAHLALLDYEPERPQVENPPDTTAVAFDSALERLAAVSRDGWVQLRRISDDGEVAGWRGSTMGSAHLAFSPDGRVLAVLFYDGVLRVFELSDHHLVFELPGVLFFNFDQRGSRIAVQTNDQSVQVIEWEQGRVSVRLPVRGNRWTACFSPDGTGLALSAERGIEIWDLASGELREKIEHETGVTAIAWRGELMAAGDAAGEVRVWNTRTHRSRRLTGHQNLISGLVFHPQSDLLVSTSYDGTTRFWEAYTGRLFLTTPRAFAERFNPDGSRLAYWTRSGWGVWRERPRVGYRAIHCAGDAEMNVWHVDFSPDSKLLAATKSTGVEFFRPPDGEPMGSQSFNLARCGYFLPEGHSFLTGSAEAVTVWSVERDSDGSNAPVRLVNPHGIDVGPFTWLEPGSVSWDRRRYVLPVSQTDAAVIDLERASLIRRLTNAILPKLSSISPNGRWIATGTFHGEGTRIWDALTGEPLHDLNEGNTSAYFSPDDRFFVSAGASAYRIYRPGTWELLHEISTDSGTQLAQVAAFASDGGLLAMVKEMNRVELLQPGVWNLATSLISPDPKVVTWMAFSPDSQWLAVATAQDLVELWDLGVLRRELSARGLGWDGPGISVGPAAVSEQAPLAWSNWSVQAPRLIMSGVVVVLACGWFVRYRQGRLLLAYLELDRLAGERSRDLQSARAEILHGQKMKALGTLAAGIAHDFNNLLSVIRMSNKLIAREAKGSVPIQESAAEIEQAVQRGKSVVRSMLGYSREGPDTTEPFSVPELVEDTVALLSKQFLSGIVLTLELDRGTPLVHGSRGRLEQILLNLIVNAAEAMSGNGKLLIGVRMAGGSRAAWVLAPRGSGQFVEMTVQDSGPGIAAGILPRIFEPFFTTKNVGAAPGTGLGLLMVYNLAQQDGLGISVESSPGAGASFRITIPVSAGTPLESSSPAG